jgi:hypothetical protein
VQMSLFLLAHASSNGASPPLHTNEHTMLTAAHAVPDKEEGVSFHSNRRFESSGDVACWSQI